MSAYRNYYDSSFGKKKDEEKSATARIASKYGAYGSGYQRDSSASGSSSYSSRLKPTLEKKETNHPPVSYRALARTTPRSRDPSPDKSSSSSSYNYNRLYPTRPYTRSVSRELDTSTTIPKYSGRSSLSKDDVSSRRSSVSREDLSKYTGRSSTTKEDLVPKYSGRSSLTKDDLSRYKPTSREDLSSSSQKYINSRFLPKNSVEKSYTAYTRPSAIRSHETIRKNRELLNVLHAQQEQSRPTSRCDAKTPPKEPETETVSTITRATSPSPTTTNIARSRRTEIAKTVEKQTTRAKNRPMSDKEVQSDDTKNPRVSGAGRMVATPWSSFLDMKFSSPNDQTRKSVSRTNSSKSLEKKSPPKKTSPTKQLLPPQIPKSDSKSSSLHSISTANKDFRKSVLNMNPEGGKKKVGRRSNSASSAESEPEVQASEATDVSENLTSCPSYHKSSSSSSKLPQRVDKGGQRSRRSPSSDGSTSSSSASEEEKKDLKVNSSRTSMAVSSADESPKPPPSPRLKSEAEAKSFLMRALAPVTSLFKTKYQGSSDKINWMDESPPTTPKSDQKPAKNFKKIESGERAWWLDDTTASCSLPKDSEKSQPKTKPFLRNIDSGEIPWWLDKNAEVPEGVQTYPEESPQKIFRLGSTDTEPSSNIMDADYQERHKIRHIDSGERSWWLSSAENIPEMVQAQEKSEKPKYAIRHQESGEKAWWLQSNSHSEEFDQTQAPLGDRASPEGLEMPEGRLSPYDNVPVRSNKGKKTANLFISKHRNIDEILGGCGPMWIFDYQGQEKEEKCMEVDAKEVRIHDSTPQRGVIQPARIDNIGGFPKTFSPYGKLDDAALQLYKDGDYGSYLDLEASISEQQEEFEGFQSNKKNSIVLRTQLSVRVHTIIEKLLTSEGRELRRALFSLKQIFQEDKDLVHEFVQNDGLSCLIKVGSEADQNYQNYILRALGQVMLYVDGMNGVMEHNQTIQWLYSLISSKFRLVVKTALKLLLVFVEYTESNCLLLIKAIQAVDFAQGVLPWHNIMKLLKDFDSADTELLIYATTLINKVLNGVPDQDTYYDQTDSLEEQEIERIIQRYMSKPGTDLDLLQQFQIYEAVLQYEDGEEGGTPIRHLDESIRKTLRTRKSVSEANERRKSRRHSTGTSPHPHPLLARNNNRSLQINVEDDESSSSQSSEINNSQLNGCYKDSNKATDAGVTPALRRRRERAERQRSFMREQQETVELLRAASQNEEDENENNLGNYTNALQQRIANRKDITPLMNAVNKLDSEENLTKQPWILYDDSQQPIDENTENSNENERNVLLQLKRENTVKDLTQKLANQNILHSPSDENKPNRIGDMTGLISKAKEGLAKSKSKADVLKSPTTESPPKIEVKKSENELRWEELVANLDRPLNLCDMDFTDLGSDDEADVLAPAAVFNGIPPPPPPLKENGAPPPPPLSKGPPPVPNPPVFGVTLPRMSKQAETKIPIKKNKKTVKLFWKEVREDPVCSSKLKTGFIWDELKPVCVDTQKLEHLFESRAKDLITKEKQQEMNKNKEIIVLDPKRSNAINIGMTKLPPPRSIKTAILKMDATIMNREGIEKLLTMLPTEEERSKIQEAQAANPDLPLGSAEQFLLTLASISELPARLKLWAFKLDFENSEREIAEPLMDLKQGIEVLRVNKTFRGILSTLLSIGNFLNGNEVKGFQIDYLAKVPEVKDTVHKHSLLHHLCHIVMEKFPDATDLYSEIGAITRASKIDFDELALNIQRLEADCKASWDHLKLIAKHDGSTMMKVKMSDFLADCAERIILVGIIHRRVMNRFHKFLLWLGIPLHQLSDTKPNEFCRIVSEFALEYRTTRERVLQQLEKKANHRERNKTRGKMITDIGKFRTKEDRADAELRQLLGSDISDVESMQGTLPWRRTRRDSNRSFLGQANGNLTDGDDEILESLVKTATKGPSRTAPRERKRTRHADRKSLRRTLKNGLSEEEKKHLSAYIKGY
nr:PREDICTED: FH1/FH2 domain-containing protein 3 isoform X3 [Tribolium castaneum]|eukprot:XP_015834225.1 PREDICTED: FH1/FH2 domain-containing protein 3 isoform X3 [Tribolium castaneum]